MSSNPCINPCTNNFSDNTYNCQDSLSFSSLLHPTQYYITNGLLIALSVTISLSAAVVLGFSRPDQGSKDSRASEYHLLNNHHHDQYLGVQALRFISTQYNFHFTPVSSLSYLFLEVCSNERRVGVTGFRHMGVPILIISPHYWDIPIHQFLISAPQVAALLVEIHICLVA